MTWSRSTSPSSMTGSSASSSSNSSDSGFSLMRDSSLQELDGANLNQRERDCNVVIGVCEALPFWEQRCHPSMDQLVELEDRQQHGEHDPHDEKSHEDNQQRTEEAHQCGQQAVELAFLADG